jgi:hypothetical protein
MVFALVAMATRAATQGRPYESMPR